MSDIINDVSRHVGHEFAKRMEKELRGAWRAGYNYVHVYSEHPTQLRVDQLKDALTYSQYVLPSHSPQRPDPDELAYQYTYDLTSVDDATIRDAIKGYKQ